MTLEEKIKLFEEEIEKFKDENFIPPRIDIYLKDLKIDKRAEQRVIKKFKKISINLLKQQLDSLIYLKELREKEF